MNALLDPFFKKHTKTDAIIKARALANLRASIPANETLPPFLLKSRATAALIRAADELDPDMGKVRQKNMVREILRAIVGGPDTGRP